MKRISFILLTLVTLTFRLAGQSEIKLSDQLVLTKLNDTVLVATHYFPWESNSLIVKASKTDVVLIDTPYDNAATELLLNWINSNLSPKSITAIITGFHIDNLGGNGYLRKKGINIYGSDLTCKLIDQKGQQTQAQIISWLKPDQQEIKKIYESMTFTKPNKTYKIADGLRLKRGNMSFEVYFPGASHSPDNVVVYIPEINLLFGGCMVKSLSSTNLGFTGDAILEEWPVSISKLITRYEAAKLVIPHHGMWGDRSLLYHTITLLGKQSTLNN